MTTFTDPVAVLRAATTQATTAPTTRILDATFTTGPMPLAHVHLLNTGPTDDVDRTDTIGIDIYATPPAPPRTAPPRSRSVCCPPWVSRRW